MKKLLILILFFSQAISAQQLSWPEITRNARPWTRWWWPGSIVSQADLTVAMQKYKDAGLGGLELTVIYGVKGEENKFIDFLSPKWMEMFTYTLKEGERLGIDIDLADSHLGSLAYGLFRHTHRIGHLAPVFVDEVLEFLQHRARAVHNQRIARQLFTYLFYYVEGKLRFTFELVCAVACADSNGQGIAAGLLYKVGNLVGVG